MRRGFPHLLSSMPGQALQCIGAGQQLEVARVETGAPGKVLHALEGSRRPSRHDALGHRIAKP